MMNAFNDKDKVLVRYLLNELSETETRELEDEILLDDELFERMQVVEMNLIDGYVRGEMTSEEHSRFEEKFLASLEKSEKVNNARIFHNSLRRLHEQQPIVSPAVVPKQGWLHRFAGLFLRPLPVLAFTALALFFIFVAFYVMSPSPDSPANSNTVLANSSPTTPDNVDRIDNSEATNSANVTATPRQNKLPEGTTNNKAPKSSTIELARNETDKYTQNACLFCQGQRSVERSGGNPLPITLAKKMTHLRLIYELLDEIPKRETFVVTIKNKYNDPIVLKNGERKQEIRPVLSKGKKRKRRFIILKIPTSVFKDSGPYTFEIDEPNFSPASFTIKK